MLVLSGHRLFGALHLYKLNMVTCAEFSEEVQKQRIGKEMAILRENCVEFTEDESGTGVQVTVAGLVFRMKMWGMYPLEAPQLSLDNDQKYISLSDGRDLL